MSKQIKQKSSGRMRPTCKPDTAAVCGLALRPQAAQAAPVAATGARKETV